MSAKSVGIRVVVALLVLSAGTGAALAMCGFAGWNSLGVAPAPAGTAWVGVYSPVFPFGMDGFASVGMGTPFGVAMANMWLAAVDGAPNDFLQVMCAASPGCPDTPPDPPDEFPPALCLGATASIMF